MAWLTGITGKAEEFLNKLDQNAAVVLQKEKSVKKFSNEQLVEVTTSSENLQKRYTPPPPKSSPLKAAIPLVKSSPNLSSAKVPDEDHLMQFLNTPTSVDIEVTTNKENGGILVTEKETEGSSKQTNIDMIGTDAQISSSEKECQLLKNEVRSLNNEMSLLLHRTKAAEKETEKLKNELSEAEGRISRLQADLQGSRLQSISDAELIRSLQTANELLTQQTSDSTGKQTEAIEEFQQKLQEAEAKRAATISELAALQNRLQLVEEEKLCAVEAREAAQTELTCVTQRVAELCAEYDAYRTRAQRTLANKEQLIAELRKSPTDSSADSLLEIELQQIREERAALAEENQQLAGRLEAARGAVTAVEARLEAAAEGQQRLREAALEETRKRQAAEDDCRAQAEELQSIREELNRQRVQLQSRLRERDAELSRLRMQLGASTPRADGEVEARLKALTATLVQKQTSLEVVGSERNALRLQLEEIEHKYREAISMLNHVQGRMINVNDTDDAKAQVPTFLMESPFDTSVTRRVKRAYSSLDAVGIRTSIFLRRYPLARIIVLFYVIVLHLWVFLVLFSYTPDNNTTGM
ncbi:golgin-84-like [Nilaparvata lugens]|uniref:golgin-84-like n=1 Tax=Nilaparvata lugens TaxID=108931 RepID=UPI00193E82F6|nr:golgin-84-like [Nilaparvata lugens]